MQSVFGPVMSQEYSCLNLLYAEDWVRWVVTQSSTHSLAFPLPE